MIDRLARRLRLLHTTLVPGGSHRRAGPGAAAAAADPQRHRGGRAPAGAPAQHRARGSSSPSRSPARCALPRARRRHLSRSTASSTASAPTPSPASALPTAPGPPLHARALDGPRAHAACAQIDVRHRDDLRRPRHAPSASRRGCVRFSYVAAGSRTPRRYRCQPDLAERPRRSRRRRRCRVRSPIPSATRSDVRVRRRVKPEYTGRGRTASRPTCSCRSPGRRRSRTGAEDGSEMGVYCHLKQPQREANLQHPARGVPAVRPRGRPHLRDVRPDGGEELTMSGDYTRFTLRSPQALLAAC